MSSHIASITSRTISAGSERAARPLCQRAFRVDNLAPEYRDTRISSLQGERREQFGLAMSDFFQTLEQADSLPLLAFAAREARDATLQKRVFAQLEEMSTWSPLNRPGWSLCQVGPPPSANFNDGNWLGTGLGIRVITRTLNILGDETLADLRYSLETLLRTEVASVRDDFAAHRPWYWNSPVSNQFVLPNTGVLQACLCLGGEAGDADYEFAVQNLLNALDSQGADGAHHEGTHYGVFTTKEILHAALAAAQAGDGRLAAHPQLKNFGGWLSHLLQPGGRVVNFFDGSDRIMSFQPEADAGPLERLRLTQGQEMLDCLMLCALLGHHEASVVLRSQFPSLYPSELSVAAARFLEDRPAAAMPPSFAAFSSSPLVTWRSSWADEADGVWVRGGSAADTHDHADRGHVNYIVRGREWLIEAGSAEYGASDMAANFQMGAGHNVLQIGSAASGAACKGRDAAITVTRLDAAGGDVTVDATAAYDGAQLQKWTRRVRWSDEGLRIDDRVNAAQPEIMLFRWHLGGDWPVEITVQTPGYRWRISWLGGALTLQADAPLKVSSVKMPHGLTYTRRAMHTCLIVETASPVGSLQLTTRVGE